MLVEVSASLNQRARRKKHPLPPISLPNVATATAKKGMYSLQSFIVVQRPRIVQLPRPHLTDQRSLFPLLILKLHHPPPSSRKPEQNKRTKDKDQQTTKESESLGKGETSTSHSSFLPAPSPSSHSSRSSSLEDRRPAKSTEDIGIRMNTHNEIPAAQRSCSSVKRTFSTLS